MSSSLDLNLLPLVRQSGNTRTELPGLYVADPPRRPARSRKGDRLFLYFCQEGNAPLTPAHQQQTLGSLGQVFYGTSGSVTSAMRRVAEELNKALLERNVRSASSSQQTIGLLAQAVLRDDRLYLAHSGPLHTFTITAEGAEHWYDPQTSGRGLGLGRSTPIRFFQLELKPFDSLLMSAEPAATWSPNTLSGLHGQGPESLRRRLLGRAGLELSAVLIQAQPGKGEVTATQTRGPLAPAEAAEGREPVNIPQPVDGLPTLDELSTSSRIPAANPPEKTIESSAGSQASSEAATVLVTPAPVRPATDADESRAGEPPESVAASPLRKAPEGTTLRRVDSAGASQAQPAPDGGAAKASPRFSLPQISLRPLFRGARAGLRPIAVALHWIMQTSRSVLQRILPDDALLNLPTGTMAFIAVAVPLVVVVLASMVYFRVGYEQKFLTYFQMAQQTALEADAETEPLVRRAAWEKTLDLLAQSEEFANNEQAAQVSQLRQYVQSDLDLMDNIKRPQYQQAIIGGLPETVNIVRMLVVDNDLYMLDGSSGNILRAFPTTNGYELDGDFQCGPSFPTGLELEKLVDMASAPEIEIDTAVLGIDGKGRLVRCGVGREPDAKLMALPYRDTEDPLTGISESQNDYYVLDPAARAVWVYWNADFETEPRFYFSEQVPDLVDVVDMAAEKQDLYLLHNAGNTTVCEYSGLSVSPTRCTETPYLDGRSATEGERYSLVSPLTQILYNPPPDPSLYFLQPENQAIYHFSLGNLVFQRQFRPAESIAGNRPATAFAVNRLERLLFLAVGNDVFFASMP